MVMRSPACFIFWSELMVTFFKVHLREIVGAVPSAMPSSGRRPRKVQRRTVRLEAHQPTGRITRRAASSSPRSQGLVVRRTRAAPEGRPDQIIQRGLVLEVIHVARVDDQQGRL